MLFGGRFTAPAHRSQAIALEQVVFTPEETAQLQRLRRQYLHCPDCFHLDLSYRRMDFYRWLARRGTLSEGIEGRA